jgi:hypothetical protein
VCSDSSCTARRATCWLSRSSSSIWFTIR